MKIRPYAYSRLPLRYAAQPYIQAERRSSLDIERQTVSIIIITWWVCLTRPGFEVPIFIRTDTRNFQFLSKHDLSVTFRGPQLMRNYEKALSISFIYNLYGTYKQHPFLKFWSQSFPSHCLHISYLTMSVLQSWPVQREFDPKNMPFRRLGPSGLRVPLFSLGGCTSIDLRSCDQSKLDLLR